jgi:anti-sigma-K factor RskA
MKCEELKGGLELYALGLLDGEEKDELDAHLGRDCETCHRSLKSALAMNSMMLSFVPAVAPPGRLKRRVMASIGVQKSSWTWAALLAAGAMLVVALWFSVQERQRTQELTIARKAILSISAQRDRMQQALSFLEDPESVPVRFNKGRGNVFVNARSGVLLVASNLPELPSGRIYEMWLIPKGAAPRPAGLFQSDATGTAFHILSGAVDRAALGVVAVTIEPESGSAAPTTTPIITAPL